MEEHGIDLMELWHSVRRHLAVIILTGFIFAVAAFTVSKFALPKEYQATTTLLVVSNNAPGSEGAIEYNQVLTNQKLVATYREILKSNDIAQRVIKELGVKMTPKQFSEMVYVEVIKNTEILKLYVTSPEAELSVKIADTTASIFKQTVQSIMKVDNVAVLDQAEYPRYPIKPNNKKNGVIGGFAGVAFAIACVVIRKIYDRTITKDEQVQELTGLPVIGRIPYSVKEERRDIKRQK